MDPYVAARQMDTDEIVSLAELRALARGAGRDGLPVHRYRRIKNPRIWSLHDLRELVSGVR
jgi:3-methylcrotonyl-CoA carboxylase beta subunit